MINVRDINIPNWHTMLQDIDPQKDVSTDKVICLVKKDGERFYEVLDKSDWENLDPEQSSSYYKLRLRDIISISNRLMAEKSRAFVSINPLTPIIMPINAWKKKYHIGLLVRIPQILNSKDLLSISDVLLDTNGQKVSVSIIEDLLEIEEENQLLREIFTYLEIMSEKADQNRLQRVQTIWERFIHWFCTLIFGDDTSNIKQQLEVELGEKDQVLDIAASTIQAMMFQVANQLLKEDGLSPIPLDQFVNQFPDGAAIRMWALLKGPHYKFIIRLSYVWDNIKKAKQSNVVDEKVE